jgi:glucuronoarabinoxylan endo-1,4-beta-xylanase
MTRAASMALAFALMACSPAQNTPQTGSQTNWLLACDSSEDCGELECLCGVCTASCESEVACSALAGASCIAPSGEASIALCGGSPSDSGLCLPTPAVHVEIDATMRHQTLVGFGASLAHADDAIAAHAHEAALYDLLFEDAGLDALRLRNRYESAGEPSLQATRAIVEAAAARLGRTPFLFMSSGTPPAALKANESRTCAGDAQTCTLASVDGGGFDYAGFARYWRESLAAYASAGVVPDYVSIQNTPNWVPPEDAPLEACRFLPEQGTETLMIDGAPVAVPYPGYSEALAAVRAAIGDLPNVPRFAAPEVSSVSAIAAYTTALGATPADAFALHMYGQDAAAVDVASLETARDLAEQLARPVFQTEMQAEGLETAVLMHHALTAAGASVYLQNDLVALTPATASVSLVLLTDTGLEPQGPFYALLHFAKRTNPGWARIAASSDDAALLSSAWLSPDEDALTVVLINSGAEDRDAEVVVPAGLRAQLGQAEVTRTVFEGVERAAQLGALSAEGVVRVPARSIATIAFATQ